MAIMTPPQPETKKQYPPEQNENLQELRDLYAQGPEVGRTALEKLTPGLQEYARAERKVESAGRTGLRQGKVSELTVIAPLGPGGAKRLRARLNLLSGNFGGAEKVGSVHDMRSVIFDNDTKLLFTTAYDGEWDAYIDDFATQVPDALDMVFIATGNFPGLRTPGIKDWIAKFLITADGWYVANPDLTVVETKRIATTPSITRAAPRALRCPSTAICAG
jgi:hypothetical protein